MTGRYSAVASREPVAMSESTGIAIGDWDDLLSAVKARLRLTVGACSGATAQPQATDRALWVQTGVLECVAALDQLQATLAHDRWRSQQLELEVFAAQSELAQARAELICSRFLNRRGPHLVLHQGLEG